jgi:hypothetical protein
VGLTALLDREHARVAAADGADFLRQLPDYIELTNRKRSARKQVTRMKREAEKNYEQFIAHENDSMGEAIDLRADLVAAAPEVDDSDMAEPDRASHEYGDYMASLAYFDQLVGQTIPIPVPTLPNDGLSPEPVTTLLGILRGRIYSARFGDGAPHLIGSRPDRRPDLAPFDDRLADLAQRHGRKLDEFLLRSRTHPGFAYMRLENFAGAARPVEEPEEEPDSAGVIAGGWWTASFVARRVMSGAHLQDWEQQRLQQMVAQLKGQLDLFHARLIRELGLSESRPGRSAALWFGSAVGNAVVQISVAAVVVTALGFFGGYLLGHKSHGGSQTVTIRETTTGRK